MANITKGTLHFFNKDTTTASIDVPERDVDNKNISFEVPDVCREVLSSHRGNVVTLEFQGDWEKTAYVTVPNIVNIKTDEGEIIYQKK